MDESSKRLQPQKPWIPFPFLKALKPSANKFFSMIRFIIWLVSRFFSRKPKLIARLEKSLIVLDDESAKIAYEQGAFGKATMSRGEKTWFGRYYLGHEPNGLTEKRLLDSFNENEHDWYESRQDPELFVLMPVETFFLAYGLGVLQVMDGDKKFKVNDLWRHFSTAYPGFPVRYAVYHFFRSKGWTARSGLALGFEFVLYKNSPSYSHADYCIWILQRDKTFNPREINAKVRVANSVKKVHN